MIKLNSLSEEELIKQHLLLQEENRTHLDKIAELNSTAEALAETNRLKERLLNILSHDVYSPLRFSTMVGKAVLTKNEELSKDQIIDALTDINQTGTRVLLLISNVLKWVEYEKNNFKPNYSVENIFQLVSDKIDFFRFMANSKNIDLINKIPNDILINTDKIAFGVILQNLLNNAIKFTPDGEIEMNIFLDVDTFTLSISDTGKGMSLEYINAIKNGDTIIPQTDTDNLKGNCLGWSLIKELLQHLNGSFDIKSGENMGTTVSITLPI